MLNNSLSRLLGYKFRVSLGCTLFLDWGRDVRQGGKDLTVLRDVPSCSQLSSLSVSMLQQIEAGNKPKEFLFHPVLPAG